MISQTIFQRLCVYNNGRVRRLRMWWVKPWLLKQPQHGAHHVLLQELRDEDTRYFFNFLRMDTQHFQQLLTLVILLIQYIFSMMYYALSRDSV